MTLSPRVKVTGLGVLGLLACGTAFAIPAIPQEAGYHAFADTRAIFGVLSFWNVVSNAAFLAVGAAGLLFLRRTPGFIDPGEKLPYAAFFGAVLLTGLGSAYYHRAPDDSSLFWDRLPMALAFMAIFAATVSERIGPAAGKVLLLPFLAAGAGSVLHWRLRGDLSFYILVQYASIAGILLMILAFPPRYTRARDLLLAVAVYGVGKACELLDGRLFSWGELLSGHTLKHLISAAAAACVIRMLRRRVPAPRDENSLSGLPAPG